MRIAPETQDITSLAVDLLVIPVFAGAAPHKFTGPAALIDKASRGMLSEAHDHERFTGKEGTYMLVRMVGKVGPAKVLLLGASGKPLKPRSARTLAAVATKLAREQHVKTVAFALPNELGATPMEISQAVTEGAMLGDYRFLKYKDKALKEYTDAAMDSFDIAVPKRLAASVQKGISRGMTYSRATILARGLVNEPASEITPGRLADTARALAAASPKRLTAKILDAKEMKELKMGGVLAVAKGSDEAPYFIHLTYKPVGKAKKKIVVIGKGITFDSGGLSIKTSKGMEDMKIDMAGCAAMLGAMSALIELAPQVEVHGISAVCENMPSGKAMRPGDIVRTMSGKTIEILNTDAEGRVTLADALHYGVQLKPDAMVDLATLTGACIMALGEEVAGMMCNDQKLAGRLSDAANAEGELLWELPLVDEYRKTVVSRNADLRNISTTSYGGAITAGVFLEEFVDSVPWAHLDMAGPAYAERDTVPHQPHGATGFGVRTILRYIERL